MTTRAQVTVAAQGTQGPPGLRWMGVYDPTAAYTVRDLVRDNDNNIIYIVIADVAANSNYLLTNTTYFEVFSIQVTRAPGLVWRGDYDANVDYAAKDLIRDPTNNSVYYLLVDVQRNSNPDFENAATAELVLRNSTVTNEDIAALNTLAPYSQYLQTVAGIAADVSSVAADSSDIGVVATNATAIGTVATNLNQGASSSVSIVSTNIADVGTVAGAINNAGSPLNSVVSNAAAAQSSATAAATSATNAATSATAAATSATAAATAQAAVETIETNINSRFVGAYSQVALPTSVPEGSFAYNDDTNRLVVWDGTQWLTGLEGPSGAGIQSFSYNAGTDTLTITYDNPGTTAVTDERIGAQNLDFGAYRIHYSNNYASFADLPSATTYPGMFVLVGSTPYFSKNGGWHALTFTATAAHSN
jgi:hypothetical protein